MRSLAAQGGARQLSGWVFEVRCLLLDNVPNVKGSSPGDPDHELIS